MCALTHTHRHTVFKSEKRFENCGSWTLATPARMWYPTLLSKSYDSILDTAQCIHHAMLYLNPKNIPQLSILQKQKKAKIYLKVFPKQS